ncbi:neuropeptide [Echinococcus multilocularis]|uniref:Neuropeptide n=1 Tax=Echinococcus multilocularis TaxID=6211 RepID=A0A068Y771_ECHMU|nr:neuropeptide [Echinococcus multilocularis]
MIKQVCFVFAAALVFYSQVSSAASPAGEELVSLLVCRTCDGIFPRSACLESQEIRSTCLQKILEEEELFSQISKRRGFIGRRGTRLQKRRGFIG